MPRRAKRRRRRGFTPPQLPDNSQLRALLVEHPVFRFLVSYCESFSLQTVAHFRGLPKAMREMIATAVRTDQESRMSWEYIQGFAARARHLVEAVRRQIPDNATPEERCQAWANASFTPPTPPMFARLVAWALMEQDNSRALQDPKVSSFVDDELCPRWQISREDAIRWSYVPVEVAHPDHGLLPVMRSQTIERSERGPEVRRLRQLQKRDLPVHDEATVPRRQEKLWWKALGLNQNSPELTRQQLWDEVFKPLVEALLPPEKQKDASLRQACRDASRLVHLRYPGLWPDRPESVRKRYYH